MSIIEEKIASSLFILHKLQQRLHNFMESKPRKIKTRSWCWKLIYFSYINVYSSNRMKIAYTHMTWLAAVTPKHVYNLACLQSSIWATIRLPSRRFTVFFWFIWSWLWTGVATLFATTAWRSWIDGARSPIWICKIYIYIYILINNMFSCYDHKLKVKCGIYQNNSFMVKILFDEKEINIKCSAITNS